MSIEAEVSEFNSSHRLTAREREIASYIAQGYDNGQIASICFLSESTVKTHVRNIMIKSGVHKREEFIKIYPRENQETAIPSTLTKREEEVLYEIADGKSNKQIANKLGLSEYTVKTHITHLYRKLEPHEGDPRIYVMTHFRKEETRNVA